jgi:hypothetical protein
MLQAFHNDQTIKDKYIARVEAHEKADRIVRGTGWDGERGGAVGCTLENYDPSRYPVELGIPEWLARVEDTLFEGMSAKKASTWPRLFLSAITPGDNLERIKAPFLIMVLESTLTAFDHDKFPDVKSAVDGSIALWKRDDIGSAAWTTAAEAAVRAAWAASRAAVRAAEAASRAAVRATAEPASWASWAAEAASRAAEAASRAAEAAAEAAAEPASRASWAAWAAVRASAEAAWAAAEAAAWAEAEAWAAKYDYFAEELLKMLSPAQEGATND